MHVDEYPLQPIRGFDLSSNSPPFSSIEPSALFNASCAPKFVSNNGTPTTVECTDEGRFKLSNGTASCEPAACYRPDRDGLFRHTRATVGNIYTAAAERASALGMTTGFGFSDLQFRSVMASGLERVEGFDYSAARWYRAGDLRLQLPLNSVHPELHGLLACHEDYLVGIARRPCS